MDETHCIVAGDTPMVPGGLANRPSASKAHGCRGGTQLHGRGWEFGIPMEPAMALHGGAKGKDPAGPSDSSLGPAVLAPSLGLGAGDRAQAAPGRSFSFISGTEEGEEPGSPRAASAGRGAPRHHQHLLGCQQAVHAALPALSSAPLSPQAGSMSPPCSPDGPFGRLFCTHTCSPLSRAQSCALTLLAGLQLFHFQVMGELCKRNPTGLRRSIPAILCSPWLPLPPLRHRTSVWLHSAQPTWECGCLGAPATG